MNNYEITLVRERTVTETQAVIVAAESEREAESILSTLYQECEAGDWSNADEGEADEGEAEEGEHEVSDADAGDVPEYIVNGDGELVEFDEDDPACAIIIMTKVELVNALRDLDWARRDATTAKAKADGAFQAFQLDVFIEWMRRLQTLAGQVALCDWRMGSDEFVNLCDGIATAAREQESATIRHLCGLQSALGAARESGSPLEINTAVRRTRVAMETLPWRGRTPAIMATISGTMSEFRALRDSIGSEFSMNAADAVAQACRLLSQVSS